MLKCRFVGIPGSGKTTKGMEIIAKVQERGYSLDQIGYCTFTRAARREASSRAAQCFGVKYEDLERHGWFRTIHSAAMRSLTIPRGSIVNYDVEWLRNTMNDDSLDCSGDEEDGEAWTSQWKGKSTAAMVLGLWDIARNRLLPFEEVMHGVIERMGPNRQLFDVECAAEDLIDLYEKAKKRDERLDFCDCLLRYVGCRMSYGGPIWVEPEGTIPPGVQAWIFDESQDTSALLDKAAQRLASESEWWYLMGDPLQSIYEWSGADGNLFMKWPVVHEEYLRKSWRCSEKILRTGLNLIIQNDNFTSEIKKMAFESKGEGGKVEDDWLDDWQYHIDGRTPTLVMARTNQKVAQLQAMLTQARIPWKSAKTGKRWPPKAAITTSDAFESLATGSVIGGDEWRRIVAAVPAAMLVRGTKTKFLPAASAADADFVTLGTLKNYGGTEELQEYVASGKWTGIVSREEREAQAAHQKWGDVAVDPAVIVSTIHCSPGGEKVLTAQDGWVPIEQLDEGKQGLVSYMAKCNRIFRGRFGRKRDDGTGYEFKRKCWSYIGRLMTIQTDSSTAQVTPGHKVRVRFAESAAGKYVVYLMRRGEWWRIGRTRTFFRPYRSGGLQGRLATEYADAGWVLGMYNTEKEATVAELCISATYGIPTFCFTAYGRVLTSEELHGVHESIKKTVGVRITRLMGDFGLDADNPIFHRGQKHNKRTDKGFLTVAANLVPGLMEVQVLPDDFKKTTGSPSPSWKPFVTDIDEWEGTIYGLEVTPHEHYFSGGQLVHNSTKGMESEKVVLCTEIGGPVLANLRTPEGQEEERRVWYVGATRARDHLVLLKSGRHQYTDLIDAVEE